VIVNPNALLIVALAAVIGALLGSALAGLAVGLGIVFVATIMSTP